MTENIIYTDLNLPESTKPRLQQVTDVQGSTYAELRVKSQDTNAAMSHTSSGRSCCSRKRVAALVALLVVIILLLVLAGCLVHQCLPTASSPESSKTSSPTSSQDSTTLSPTTPQDSATLSPTTPQDSTSSHTSKKPSACPKQWEKHGRKAYCFHPNKRQDWNASRKECTAMGSDLVIIANEEELRYLSERSRYNYYLLGLTYSEREQKWKWINNMDHDPALFRIDASYSDYHCTVIGFGEVRTAPCGGSSTTQNMCERAATMSAR